MADAHGRFCWYDLMTSDPEAAVSFYGDIIGWGTETWEGAEKPYTMWTVDDTPIGGIMGLPEAVVQQGVPPHWISYVAVDDIDRSLTRVAELGGSVMHPATEIPDVGRFAIIQDPQSATIALFKPAGDTPGNDGDPSPGHFSWHELATSDWEAAFDFYHRLFGWEKIEAMDMGEFGTYQIYGRDGRQLGGIFNKPPQMPVITWLYYAMVADVDKTVDRVKEAGGQVLNGPMDVPGGDRIAQCVDPQGGAFAIHSRTDG